MLFRSQNYAPGAIPKGMDVGTQLEPSRAFNRWQNYRPDTDIPMHRITFNGIVDVPLGKGRRFMSGGNKFLNAAFGGFQLAFVGTVRSQAFQVANMNWGATNPITLYKDAAPVKDCRSGVCRNAFMWFNGYLPPNQINSATGVQGVPTGYQPYLAPINNTPGAANFGTNNVSVPLSNGQTVTTPFSPGPNGTNPYNAMVLQGPKNFQSDVSIYKEFAIGERYRLRFNVDAFNAFNIQGLTNPNTTDGLRQIQSSYWTPRQIQFTGRFTF